MRKFRLIVFCLGCSLLFGGCSDVTKVKTEVNPINAPNKLEDSKNTPIVDADNVKETSSRENSNSHNNNFMEKGFELSKQELLFIFNKDISSVGVIKLLGEPEEKSKAAVWESDGLEHQSWYYHKKGIELDMKRVNTIQSVNSLKASINSSLKTSRNICIGSTKKEVFAAYKNEINLDSGNKEMSQIVVGSVYGGLIFQIDNDKVTSIFIGAAAE